MTDKPLAWMSAEDGRKLATVKELTDKEVKERISFLKEHGASERFLQVYEEAVKWTLGAILRKAQE